MTGMSVRWIVIKAMQSKYIVNMMEHLKTLRMSCSLTQEQFAVKLGITRQTISVIEKKRGDLTWSLYLAMVLVFQQYDNSKILMESFKIFDANFIKDDL